MTRDYLAGREYSGKSRLGLYDDGSEGYRAVQAVRPMMNRPDDFESFFEDAPIPSPALGSSFAAAGVGTAQAPRTLKGSDYGPTRSEGRFSQAPQAPVKPGGLRAAAMAGVAKRGPLPAAPPPPTAAQLRRKQEIAANAAAIRRQAGLNAAGGLTFVMMGADGRPVLAGAALNEGTRASPKGDAQSAFNEVAPPGASNDAGEPCVPRPTGNSKGPGHWRGQWYPWCKK